MTGPPGKRKPRPGANGRGSLKINLVNSSNSEHKPQAPEYQARVRRRANFARSAVLEEFGYRAGRALDYDGFVDRRPTHVPRAQHVVASTVANAP